MTLNQKLAMDLARGVASGRVDPVNLPDLDWQLLLLASGVHCANARPALVAQKVLEHFEARGGYFADIEPPDGTVPAFVAVDQPRHDVSAVT